MPEVSELCKATRLLCLTVPQGQSPRLGAPVGSSSGHGNLPTGSTGSADHPVGKENECLFSARQSFFHYKPTKDQL